MGVAQLLTRTLAYVLAGAAVFFLAPKHVLTLFIFMGQAHFVLAYWYRFGSANAPRGRLFLLLAAMVAVFFSAYALQPVYGFWIVFAGVLFVAHFIIDELSLLGERRSITHGVLLFSGVIAVFLLELTQFVFKIFFEPQFLAVVAAATLMVSGYYIYRMRTTMAQEFVGYAALVALTMTPAIWWVNKLDLTMMLGFIILAHYFIWYFDYYHKLSSNRQRQMAYLGRVALVNALMFGIWLVHKQYAQLPLYSYFFTASYFYVWTCIHIVFSLVPKDARALRAPVINMPPSR